MQHLIAVNLSRHCVFNFFLLILLTNLASFLSKAILYNWNSRLLFLKYCCAHSLNCRHPICMQSAWKFTFLRVAWRNKNINALFLSCFFYLIYFLLYEIKKQTATNLLSSFWMLFSAKNFLFNISNCQKCSFYKID